MHLTSYTDYALRVLIFLGVHPNRVVQREEIANAFKISSNHLGKVVNSLGRAGTFARLLQREMKRPYCTRIEY